MDMEDIKHRVQLLEDRHKHQHKVVESLIAEKAPEPAIKSAKIKKLELKDEIEKLKNAY